MPESPGVLLFAGPGCRDVAAETFESFCEEGAGAGYVPAEEVFAFRTVHFSGVEPQAGVVQELFLQDFGS